MSMCIYTHTADMVAKPVHRSNKPKFTNAVTHPLPLHKFFSRKPEIYLLYHIQYIYICIYTGIVHIGKTVGHKGGFYWYPPPLPPPHHQPDWLTKPQASLVMISSLLASSLSSDSLQPLLRQPTAFQRISL